MSCGFGRFCATESERGVGMASIKQDKNFLWIGRILRILKEGPHVIHAPDQIAQCGLNARSIFLGGRPWARQIRCQCVLG